MFLKLTWQQARPRPSFRGLEGLGGYSKNKQTTTKTQH